MSEALSSKKPVPSRETVAALAGALKLPVQQLLVLQRTAAEEPGTVTTGGPGRAIGEWEPHDLEVLSPFQSQRRFRDGRPVG
ncbi:hypothetical protein ACGFWE_32680 [Streptomyces sp. NPDC048523]|uniref:hypothetical protein n=1 Tax=Streptomyces sp. NPDC048523 TaxID=3365567 RepID=UPI00371494F6